MKIKKKDKYSPAVIIGEIMCKKLRFKTKLSIKTVYNYRYSGVFVDIGETELTYKKNCRKRYKKVEKISKSRLHKSVEERSDVVNERKKFGHWEIDLAKSSLRVKSCLLTLSERLTRKEIIIKLCAGTVEEVDNVLTGLERKYGKLFCKNI